MTALIHPGMDFSNFIKGFSFFWMAVNRYFFAYYFLNISTINFQLDSNQGCSLAMLLIVFVFSEENIHFQMICEKMPYRPVKMNPSS